MAGAGGRGEALLGMAGRSGMTALVTEKELQEWLGIKQRTRLMKTLRDAKIPYMFGGGGRICTTQGAIDQSLFGANPKEKEEDFNFI